MSVKTPVNNKIDNSPFNTPVPASAPKNGVKTPDIISTNLLKMLLSFFSSSVGSPSPDTSSNSLKTSDTLLPTTT